MLEISMCRIKRTDRNRASSKATFAANKTGSEQRSGAACGHVWSPQISDGGGHRAPGLALVKNSAHRDLQRLAESFNHASHTQIFAPVSVLPSTLHPSTPDPPSPQSTHLTCNRLLVYFQILHRSCALRLSLLTLLEFSSVHKFVSGYLLSDKHTHTHGEEGRGV